MTIFKTALTLALMVILLLAVPYGFGSMILEFFHLDPPSGNATIQTWGLGFLFLVLGAFILFFVGLTWIFIYGRFNTGRW